MTRQATTTEIVLAVKRLGRLLRPKGMDKEVPLEDYEEVLQGVGAKYLAEATLNLLKKSKFMPFPSELYQEINRLAQLDRRHEETHKRRRFEEDDTLTAGQRSGQPLLRDDPEARERCKQLWAMVRPSLGGKSFTDAAKDMAELRRKHPLPSQLTDEQRLQLLRDKANEPIEVTEVLKRKLKSPMNPAPEEGKS